MREEEACGGCGTGPSGEWLGCCGAWVFDCCCSVFDGVSAGVAVALLESSSATGEQVSARTLCARPWRPLPLRLPSLLHSRLEPLRSSFSEELVMVAERKWKQRGNLVQVRKARSEKEGSNVLCHKKSSFQVRYYTAVMEHLNNCSIFFINYIHHLILYLQR